MLALSAGHLWFLGADTVAATATLAELEWTLAALVGFVYSGSFVRETIVDWRVSSDDQDSRTTAEILILIGFVLVGLHVLLLTLGIFAMVRPSSAGQAMTARVLSVTYVVVGQALVGALLIIRRKRALLRRR